MTSKDTSDTGHNSSGAGVGRVTLVGGGPGAWDLMTIRGWNALKEADVVLADHLGPTAELDKLIDVDSVELVDVSKLPYGKQVAQEKTNALLVEYARAGKNVVRLKGGDPYVFGRGFEELSYCAHHGVACDVVPGVTSAIAVPGAAGVPVTQRGVVHSFTVVSGHLPPGHPKSLVDWSALAKTGGSLSVIMGVKNAAAIARALMDAGRAPETPVVITQEGLTDRERSFRCRLDELEATMRDNQVTSPAVYVIGEVAGLEVPGPEVPDTPQG